MPKKSKKKQIIFNCLASYIIKLILIFKQNKKPNDGLKLINDICANTPMNTG